MISLKELNPRKYPTTKEIDANLADLLVKLNKVRAAYGKPMIITSGLRSDERQAQLIAAGKSTAVKSNHLKGLAVDIADDGKIKPWIMANMKLMEDLGLYFEDFSATKTWIHVQTVPPKSGRRFFIP